MLRMNGRRRTLNGPDEAGAIFAGSTMFCSHQLVTGGAWLKEKSSRRKVAMRELMRRAVMA
jgi:hypothetical protein